MSKLIATPKAQPGPAKRSAQNLTEGHNGAQVALQLQSVTIQISSVTATVATPLGLVQMTALQASVVVKSTEVSLSLSPQSERSHAKEIIEVRATEPTLPTAREVSARETSRRETSQRQSVIDLAREVSAIDKSAPINSSSQASAEQMRGLVEGRLNQAETKPSTEVIKTTTIPQAASETNKAAAPAKNDTVSATTRAENAPLASSAKTTTPDAALVNPRNGAVSGAAASTAVNTAVNTGVNTAVRGSVSEAAPKNPTSNIEAQTARAQVHAGTTPQIIAPPRASTAQQTTPLAASSSLPKDPESSVKNREQTTNTDSAPKQFEANKAREETSSNKITKTTAPSTAATTNTATSGKDAPQGPSSAALNNPALSRAPTPVQSSLPNSDPPIIKPANLSAPKADAPQSAPTKGSIQENTPPALSVSQAQNAALRDLTKAQSTSSVIANNQAGTNLANASGKTLATKPNIDSASVNKALSNTPNLPKPQREPKSTNSSSKITSSSKDISARSSNTTAASVSPKATLSTQSVQGLRASVVAGIENLKNLLTQTNIPPTRLSARGSERGASSNTARAGEGTPMSKGVEPGVAPAIKAPQSLSGRDEAVKSPLNRASDTQKSSDSPSRAPRHGARPQSSVATPDIGAPIGAAILSDPLAGLSKVLDGLAQAAQTITGVELLKRIESVANNVCQTVIALTVVGTIAAERILSYIAASVGELLALMRSSEARGLELPDDIDQLIEALVSGGSKISGARIDTPAEDVAEGFSLDHEASESASVADIVGIVTDEASGGPIKGVEIDGFNLGKVYTDEHGIFIIRNVPLGDNYRIAPQIEGWGFDPSELAGSCSLLNFHQFVAKRYAG